MIWLFTIFMAGLTLYLYKQTKTLNAATALSMLYLVSALCALLIEQKNLYGEYGILERTQSVTATIYLFVALLLLITPFAQFNQPGKAQTQTMLLPDRKIFKAICYVVCFCCVVYVVTYAHEIVEALTSDASDIKSMHYADMASGEQAKGQSWLFYLPNIFSGAWSLLLLLWYVSIVFMNERRWFNLMLLVCSFCPILKGSLIAGRAAIIYWVAGFVVYFCLFMPYMDARQRRRIMLSILGPLMLIGGLFFAVTASRFVGRGATSATDSLIGYAGQLFNNFNTVYVRAKDLPFTMQRLFPLFYKYVLHQSFNLLDYYDAIYDRIGTPVSCFYTVAGGLVLTTGKTIGMLLLMVFFCTARWTCRKAHETMNFSYFLLLSIAVQVPIKGMFDVPFPSTGDPLLNILTIALAVWLYTRNKAAQKEYEHAES